MSLGLISLMERFISIRSICQKIEKKKNELKIDLSKRSTSIQFEAYSCQKKSPQTFYFDSIPMCWEDSFLSENWWKIEKIESDEERAG